MNLAVLEYEDIGELKSQESQEFNENNESESANLIIKEHKILDKSKDSENFNQSWDLSENEDDFKVDKIIN